MAPLQGEQTIWTRSEPTYYRTRSSEAIRITACNPIFIHSEKLLFTASSAALGLQRRNRTQRRVCARIRSGSIVNLSEEDAAPDKRGGKSSAEEMNTIRAAERGEERERRGENKWLHL